MAQRWRSIQLMAKPKKGPTAEEMEEQPGYSACSLRCGSPITCRLYSDLRPMPDDALSLLKREYMELCRTKPADCHKSLMALPPVRA